MLARSTNSYILILKAISGKYRIHKFRQGKEIDLCPRRLEKY